MAARLFSTRVSAASVTGRRSSSKAGVMSGRTARMRVSSMRVVSWVLGVVMAADFRARLPDNDATMGWVRHAGWYLIAVYAAGYFLSYALRSVNAVIAPELSAQLHLSSADLGLLTSAYLLAFGAFQVPLGVLLDRFGPRRVEAMLLLVAALGCGIFASGNSLEVLTVGRAAMGLGVSACLMASFKAFHQRFGVERLPALTAAVMTAGSLGALCASVPVALVLPVVGWRGVFLAMALLLVLTALVLWRVPDATVQTAPSQSMAAMLRGLIPIYRSPVFWRYAPQGSLGIGGFMAYQGLWAVPWLMEVEGLSRAAAAQVLLVTAMAMLGGFLLVAVASSTPLRRHVGPGHLLGLGMGLGLLAQGGLVLDWGSGWLWWPVMGVAFSLCNVAYSQLAAAFAPEMAGRVNTALNLMVFVGAFGLQWGVGAVRDALGGVAGLDAVQGFRLVLGAIWVAQALAVLWYGVRGVRR